MWGQLQWRVCASHIQSWGVASEWGQDWVSLKPPLGSKGEMYGLATGIMRVPCDSALSHGQEEDSGLCIADCLHETHHGDFGDRLVVIFPLSHLLHFSPQQLILSAQVCPLLVQKYAMIGQPRPSLFQQSPNSRWSR